jgi:hypothetical protein
MAITIQDQPTITYIRPAFAPIEYLLSSTSTAQPGFKIVCKVYLNPSGANTLISTQQISVRPLTTQAILSIQDVVKSFVPITYSVPNGDTVGLISDTLNQFKVTFQEYYDSALQGSIVASNIISSYAASPKYIQFAANEWQDYQLATSAIEKNLLSGFDNTIPVINAFSGSNNWLKVKTTQKTQIQWAQSGATANFKVWLKTLNASFTQISLSQLDLGTTSKGYFALDIGRQEASAHAWDTPIVWTAAKYYAVAIYDESTTELVSNAYLYELDDCNTNYTPFELHWLNRWGGFDSFVFDGKSNQTTEVNKTFAKYSPDRISGTSLNYSTSAQRTRAFNTATSESYSLNSRLLQDFESVGLEDLISSPEVYWRSEAGFVSANVSGRTYQHAKSENGLVFSLALDMTIDNSDERQW